MFDVLPPETVETLVSDGATSESSLLPVALKPQADCLTEVKSASSLTSGSKITDGYREMQLKFRTESVSDSEFNLRPESQRLKRISKIKKAQAPSDSSSSNFPLTVTTRARHTPVPLQSAHESTSSSFRMTRSERARLMQHLRH